MLVKAKNIAWTLAILGTHICVFLSPIVWNKLFVNKELLARNYFQTAVFPKYRNDLGNDIECDIEKILKEKSYRFKNNDYVQYECENGTMIVYRFEKGIGRSVLLTRWEKRK